ncbi:LptF/LptG family permease [Luteolibacter flavescens]|uniref:LptF/LptG family permease n=1 Tax=Luteolibacter flavescens TaxID=1859460 RepID=A0ABT3FRE5_9BACT|nr:LptF/LptG family permease [Luteolibacter flavescens]MCW1886148.1 LptF/LptG family permease [Luteolibacter flavescens]
MPRFLVPLLLALGGVLLALKIGPTEQAAVQQQLENFPDVQAKAHLMRPVIAVFLCFLPAIGGVLYYAGDTLARYVSRQFVSNFLICILGLLAVWLLTDLGDNIDDLKDSKNVAGFALQLYLARMPEVLVTLLPYSLMLSVLYSLGLLSRSREIVAMIQTGRGLTRLTMPFFVGGVLAALLCAGLNYQWAPAAVGAEKAILRKAKGQDSVAEPNIRYRNHDDRRLWMIGSFPADYQIGAPLQRVTVIQENPNGSIARIISAKTAAWSPLTRDWSFTEPRVAECTTGTSPDGQAPDFTKNPPSDPLVVKGWSEVPAQLIRPGLPAGQLGIPDLNDWLTANPQGTWASRGGHLTQWHYRWAQPVNCIIVVMLAVPLGVVFSRRGAGGGVAVAVFLCAGMLFVSNVCLALGDSSHMKPALAAWLPNAIFGGVAIFLFQRRISGRPIYQTLRKIIPAAA